MSLDFVVLGQNGMPEKTVSLGVDLHYELVTAAAGCGLSRFQDFADYYEDAEIAVEELPSLAEQIQTLRAQTGSDELQHFLVELDYLVAYAMAQRRALNAIAD
jgi:hypothetical protein